MLLLSPKLDPAKITEAVAHGKTATEAADLLGIDPVVLRAITRQISSAFNNAIESGMPPQLVVKIAGEQVHPFVDASIREGYGSPADGLTDLLSLEGGCVPVAAACKLFRPHHPVARQTLSEQIRQGKIVAYRTAGGEYAVPVWQFRREGGVVEGLVRVVEALQEQVPGADQLTPFAFLLMPDPLTEGRPPLDLLKAGKIDLVLEAVNGRAR